MHGLFVGVRREVQASAFGVVLGLYGLGRGWMAATVVWNIPAGLGLTILVLADAVWAWLIALYILKWFQSSSRAVAELHHPILSCHVDLVFSSTLLVSISVLEYFRPAALMLAVIGWIGHCAFTVWRVGILWQGGRHTGETTPVLILPQVTGNFISALAAARFGYIDLAALFLGAGAMSWVPVEAAIIGRLFSQELPVSLRPTLGIRLSPPATACVAYLAIRDGVPDLLVNCLLGYAVLQAAVLLRLTGWIRTQDFVPSYWGFSFGLTALGWCILSVARTGMQGTFTLLALPVFVAENLVIVVFLVLTLKYLIRDEERTAADAPSIRTESRMLERTP